jgi:hypothetical protein
MIENKRMIARPGKQSILLLERGQGDSVEEIARYWGDKNIDEIHRQVIMWKAQQAPQSPSHRIKNH